MRILVVGDGRSPLHEVAVAQAFQRLGHEVETFYWNDLFHAQGLSLREYVKAQNKFLVGPRVSLLNSRLIECARRFAPQLIFIYRGTHVRATTITSLRAASPNCLIFGYTNDDPFSPAAPWYLWRLFNKAIPLYDCVFAYRHNNLGQLRSMGARRVELLRSWYIPWLNRPMEVRNLERFENDVIFVGHYEDDHRVALLESIVRRGWRLRLFGPGYDWDPAIKRSKELASQVPVRLVWGDDYNQALAGAKIALCFLSKLNRDTYTRRCFEIPATGTLLLSEYTEDLASLFGEGTEADYFRSPNELISKIDLYLSDEARRVAVAAAGFERVRRDGHDVVSRMRGVLATYDQLGRPEHERV